MSRTDHFQDITIAGNITPGAQARLLDDLIPSPDNSQDLGSSTLRYRNIYGVTEIIDTQTVGIWNNIRVVDGNKYAATIVGINQAITDAVAGDTIILPRATYTGTAEIVITKSGLRLVGAGIGGTIIQRTGGTGRGIVFDGTNHVHLDGFTLDMNDVAGTTDGVLVAGAWYSTLERIRVINSLAAGVRVQNKVVAGTDRGGYFTSLENVFVGDDGGLANNVGIRLIADAAGGVTFTTLRNVYSSFNTSHGIDISGTVGTVGNTSFIGGGSNSNGGWGINGANGSNTNIWNDVAIVGMDIESNTSGGISNDATCDGLYIISLGGNQSIQTNASRIQVLSRSPLAADQNAVLSDLHFRSTLGIDFNLTAGDAKISSPSAGLIDSSASLRVGVAADNTRSLQLPNKASGTLVFLTGRTGDTFDRFQIIESGSVRWGSGGATPDVILDRTAINELSLASGDTFRAPRIKSSGTAHVAGDYALSAGWGTTASIGSIRGNDQFHEFTVTSAGTGQGANPTITLTYKDLTWGTAPVVQVTRQEFTNQPTVTFTVTTQSAATYVITFDGTPVAAETYRIGVQVGGI